MKGTFDQIRVELKKEEYGSGKLTMCSWRRDDQPLGEELVFKKTEEMNRSTIKKQLKPRRSSLKLWFGERISCKEQNHEQHVFSR